MLAAVSKHNKMRPSLWLPRYGPTITQVPRGDTRKKWKKTEVFNTYSVPDIYVVEMSRCFLMKCMEKDLWREAVGTDPKWLKQSAACWLRFMHVALVKVRFRFQSKCFDWTQVDFKWMKFKQVGASEQEILVRAKQKALLALEIH